MSTKISAVNDELEHVVTNSNFKLFANNFPFDMRISIILFANNIANGNYGSEFFAYAELALDLK